MPEEKHADKLERWAREGRPGSQPVDAATVVLLRDGEAGLETLMLRRNSKIAFGGMWVFPGGRIDDADRAGHDAGDSLAAARTAAVREAQEEAGLELDASTLVALSHWTPPAVTPRRFLTWFFLAATPDPQAEVVIDDGEIREHAWLSPAEALTRRAAGAIELAPPTFVTLETLRRAGDSAEALKRAQSATPEHFVTHVCPEEGGPTLLWHGDAGYESTDPTKAGPRHRMRMRRAGWDYERS